MQRLRDGVERGGQAVTRKPIEQPVSIRPPTQFQQLLAIGLLLLKIGFRPEIPIASIIVVLAGHLLLGALLVAVYWIANQITEREAP